MEKHSNKTRNAVVFACDENFLPYTIFAINRIRKLEPDATYDMCIFSDSLHGDEYPFEEHEIIFHKIDMTGFKHLPVSKQFPLAAYIRLAIPMAVSDSYDRVLYCDGDTYLLKAGLQELFELDMAGHEIGAVPDKMMWYPKLPYRYKKMLGKLGLKGILYLNSGVLLFDVTKYCGSNILENTVNFAEQHSEYLPFADQTALNGALRGNWLQLSAGWNWQSNAFDDRLISQYKPNLLHFTGPKPWVSSEHNFYALYGIEYTKFLAEHFPSQIKKNAKQQKRKHGFLKKFQGWVRFANFRSSIRKLNESAAN